MNNSFDDLRRRIIDTDSHKKQDLLSLAIQREEMHQEWRAERGCPGDERIAGYVDGTLRSMHRLRILLYIRIWLHLRHCVLCAREAQELREALDLLPPLGVMQKFHSRVQLSLRRLSATVRAGRDLLPPDYPRRIGPETHHAAGWWRSASTLALGVLLLFATFRGGQLHPLSRDRTMDALESVQPGSIVIYSGHGIQETPYHTLQSDPGGVMLPLGPEKGVKSVDTGNPSANSGLSAEEILKWLVSPDPDKPAEVASSVGVLEHYLAGNPGDAGVRLKLMELYSIEKEHTTNSSQRHELAQKLALQRQYLASHPLPAGLGEFFHAPTSTNR